MKYKVRPFTRSWDLLGITISGQLRNHSFLLRIGKLEHLIAVTESGSDNFGPYALLEDQKVELEFGWSLSVEPEGDEDDAGLGLDPGCCIKLVEMDEDAVRRMGIDPRDLNVIVPPLFSISVLFDSAGQIDGFAGIDPSLRRHHEIH